MKFKQWLNESVSFYPKGWHPQTAGNTFSLAYKIDNLLYKIPGYNQGTNVEKFTIDGYDTSATNGVLNLYTVGMPDETVAKVLKAIPYYLKENGAKLISTKKEKSNMFNSDVYRFHVELNSNEKRPPEVNMSNANARAVLGELLGMSVEDLVGSINARDLLMKINQASDFAIDMTTRAPQQDGNVYSGGIDHEYIKRRLQSLEELARWAIENNYDEISFA